MRYEERRWLSTTTGNGPDGFGNANEHPAPQNRSALGVELEPEAELPVKPGRYGASKPTNLATVDVGCMVDYQPALELWRGGPLLPPPTEKGANKERVFSFISCSRKTWRGFCEFCEAV